MRFIDFIRDRARYYNCPVCGRSLRDCELRMLRHVEDRYTVQVTCAACRVQFVVILAVQGDGLDALPAEELGLDRELVEDADPLVQAMAAQPAEPEPEPIQSDEVLDVHLTLKDFQGRLPDLFKQPSAGRN
jgi:hypothetical protein